MFYVPNELIVMLSILVVLTLGLTFLIRDDFKTANGRTDLWQIIEALVGMYFMLVMLSAATLQIVVRYLNISMLDLHWTEELGRLALVWGAFWGAAALQRVDDHVRMGALYDALPPWAQHICCIIGDVTTILVLIPVVWYGWQTARNLDIMLTIALGTPLSVFAYPVPLTGAIMIIYTAILLVRRIRRGAPERAESTLVTDV